MVNGDFISNVVERAKVACYRFEGAAPHAVALLPTGNILTQRVSKDEEKNVYCTTLDCSLYYTLEHCGA